MIGYKIAKNGDRRVIVTLEIPADALTNMGRSTVAVRETATYRVNKVIVLKIEDSEGNCYDVASSFHHILKSLEYKVGELLEDPTYNTNPEEVCAEGIHFFLSRRVAELYGLETLTDGILERWHDNGRIAEKSTFVASKKHSLCQGWHTNGIKIVEDMYINGKKNGFCQEWHENGRKYEECTYVDGKKDGLYTRWYTCGDKVEESTFVAGRRHGLCRTWYKRGSQPCERIFVNGIKQ